MIGVAPVDFIGTEPGLVPDLFVPATMNTDALNANGWSWFTMCGPAEARHRAGARAADPAGGFRSGTAGAAERVLVRYAARDDRPVPRGADRLAPGRPRRLADSDASRHPPAHPHGDRGARPRHGVRDGREPADGPCDRPREGDGAPCLDRRRPRAADPDDVRRVLDAGARRVRAGRAGVVVGASGRDVDDPSDRDPHQARIRSRLASRRILGCAGPRRDGTLRVRARAAGLVGVARHGAQGRRSGALAPRRQVAARRPDDVLRVRPLRGRPLQDDVRSAVVAIVRILVRPRAGAGRGRTRRSATRGAMDADA